MTCAEAQNISVSRRERDVDVIVTAGDKIVWQLPLPSNTFSWGVYLHGRGGVRIQASPFTIPSGVTLINVENGGPTSARFSCTPAPPPGPSPQSQAVTNTTLATISASAQGGAISRGASSGASDQFGEGGGVQVTRSTVFVSTQGLSNTQPTFGTADWTAWVSAETRLYSGGNDGDSYDFVAGIGRRVHDDLIVGGLVAYGKTDLSVGGQLVENRSPAIAAYLAQRFGDDLRLDLSLAYARPEYRVTNGTFTASRQMINVGLRGSHAVGGIDLQPFARLAAYSEDQPSYSTPGGTVPRNEISAANLNLGGRIAPRSALSNGMLPYLSLAAEFNHRESTIGGTNTLWSSRLGVGMSMTFDQGFLTVDFDAGRMLDNTEDYGLKLAYQWNF